MQGFLMEIKKLSSSIEGVNEEVRVQVAVLKNSFSSRY